MWNTSNCLVFKPDGNTLGVGTEANASGLIMFGSESGVRFGTDGENLLIMNLPSENPGVADAIWASGNYLMRV